MTTTTDKPVNERRRVALAVPLFPAGKAEVRRRADAAYPDVREDRRMAAKARDLIALGMAAEDAGWTRDTIPTPPGTPAL